MSANPAPPLQHAIRRLAAGASLSAEESRSAFDAVMSGEATVAQIASLLVGLRVKGETAEEVAGAAAALRGAMVQLPAERPEELVDTCGTGGGAIGTFNISTAAALLAAGAGVRVAKHGNRSFTSQCGSADVLEALGVPIEVSIDVMERALRDAGIVFMFAPLMHPAMRHVGPVRRELGIPTVMNIVGPLANPARAGRQVVGVADARRVPLIAGALLALGTEHALVVHGEPGMDEISPLGPTQVIEIRDGRMREWSIEPAQFGLGTGRAEELAGGPPADNAAAVRAVLAGNAPPTATAAVLLNAAAALFVSTSGTGSFEDAVEMARSALDAGAGLAALERLRRAFAPTTR
ncbi:MAG: anthranilate phosphoribosyltransferase [Gemmatimonadetes bacterium]|nr:MAG: anthranilate phosphoribosyltransferase [Gemmatimonadota bacterium]